MRSVFLLGTVAVWLALTGTGNAQTVLYTAVAARDQTEVRAGPSDSPDFYVTNWLTKGTPVQVVEELSNGWLKIRAPAGSFSLIETRHLEQIAPNKPNWMVHTDGGVGVLVGTEIPKLKASQIMGCQVARGTQVTSVGPARVEGERTYLPIEPPPKEFRYVRAEAVPRGDGALLASRPAVPATSVAKQDPVPQPLTGGPLQPITESEALWQRATEAEKAGNIAAAIDWYTRAADKGQAHPELVLQARNRAYWLRNLPQTAHSTFTPSPLPPGDYRLSPTPVPPPVQLAGPVGATGGLSVAKPSAGTASTGPGHLRRAGRLLEGRRTYVLESSQGQPLFYVTPEAGVDLEPFVNKSVELFGLSVYSGELRANYMRVERVQAVP